jgi:transcriptional regulator with XRE-family HTH domain
MAKIQEKIKAQALRRRGQSINEIAQELNISKSTVSIWCRNISLTPGQIKRLVRKQTSKSYEGRLKGLEKIRQKRLQEVELLRKEGIKEIKKLNKREFLIAGVAIYWSEGYTAPVNYEVGFTNSDPKMILFMLEWFKKCCKVSDDRFSLRVGINEIHKDRIREVEKYWSQLTKIPLSQFNKISLKKTKIKKIYENHNEHYGTLRIKVRKGTRLRRKIDGWIEGLTRSKI